MDEEERSGLIRVAAMRWTWGTLVVVCFLGLLAALTVAFRWWDASVMCLLGFAAGLTVSYVALHSEQHGPVVFYSALGAGFVGIPAMAVFLGVVAASRADSFAVWNTTFTAFVVYGLSTFVVRLALARLWRPREAAQEPQAQQVEQLAEWQQLENEASSERPIVELVPPAPPPARPASTQGG